MYKLENYWVTIERYVYIKFSHLDASFDFEENARGDPKIKDQIKQRIKFRLVDYLKENESLKHKKSKIPFFTGIYKNGNKYVGIKKGVGGLKFTMKMTSRGSLSKDEMQRIINLGSLDKFISTGKND